MSNETETSAALEAGIALASPKSFGASHRFFTQVVPAGASVQTFDLTELEQAYADHPHRKRGTVHVQDALSFVEYVAKHRLPQTEVYADLARQKLVAVVNAHSESVPDQAEEGPAGHGDHRVSLELIHSDEWKLWSDKDKTWLDQGAFAAHLEDNAINVVDPDAATMLEISESLQVSSSIEFKRSERLSNGVINFQYEETQGARAGHTGDLEIPGAFVLAIAPFVGSEPVEVTARFRYRIRNGDLALSYALLNAGDIARQAFLDQVDAVRDSIEAPVFLGRPE